MVVGKTVITESGSLATLIVIAIVAGIVIGRTERWRKPPAALGMSCTKSLGVRTAMHARPVTAWFSKACASPQAG